ncbi:hypothetical protein Plhal304r1_c001g0001541 [Plasmopara halstedii]
MRLLCVEYHLSRSILVPFEYSGIPIFEERISVASYLFSFSLGSISVTFFTLSSSDIIIFRCQLATSWWRLTNRLYHCRKPTTSSTKSPFFPPS